MVDLEIDESKRWDPAARQKYMDELPEMSLFDDHLVEGDVMVEAIQALILEGETPETLALSYKNRGNDMFKNGKKHRSFYENALQNYTDAFAYALKAFEMPEEEKDPSMNMRELTSQILSNRAAVHLELKNYGSCRADVARALKYDTSNVKTYFRGAKASLMLQRADDALNYCTVGLEVDAENAMLLKLKKQAEALKEKQRIEQQLKEFERKKRRAFVDKYRQLCTLRNVKVGPAVFNDERVRQYEGKADLDTESGQMYWPVLFLYEEHNTTDFVEMFGETDLFIEHLANMFPEDGPYADWDVDQTYVASKLVVYAAADVVLPFATKQDWYTGLSDRDSESDSAEAKRLELEAKHDAKTQHWIEVSPFCSLHMLLSHDKYVVPGVPIVSIFVRGSKPHNDFLTKIDHKVIGLNPPPQ